MGITGLLPFLQKSSHRAHIRDYSGCTVAIDAYCWLHKGAFSCAEKLVMNEPTTQYVNYCMKYVNMLLSHKIKPILVFDGQNLSAKAGTEQKRRQNRDVNRRKGMELIRAGRVSEGRNILRRALDVTHLMALEVMKECRRINVDCIVAPYEADAQLAFFSINDIAHVIITEDSDLMLFGCKTVMFKMDLNGSGVVVEGSKLHLSMGLRKDQFTLDKFRFMAILSGCDYVDSLPGIGLAKACKFVTRTAETDIYKSLEKLASNLNMWTLEVTDDYRKSVVDADHTFRCQLVFDPKARKQIPLTPPRDGEGPVGELKDPSTALQLALGNLNPKNLQRVDNFDPDKHIVPRNTPGRAPHSSIWSANYVRSAAPKPPAPTILHHMTTGKTVHADVKLSPAVKREVEEDVNDADAEMLDMDMLRLYTRGSKRSKIAPLSGPMQVSRYFASNSQCDKENMSANPPSITAEFFTEDEDSSPAEESDTAPSLSSEYDTAKSCSSEYGTPPSQPMDPQSSRSQSRPSVLDDLEKLDIANNEASHSPFDRFRVPRTESQESITASRNSDEINRSPFDRFKVPGTESQESINVSRNSDEMNRSPFDRFKVPRTESQELINVSRNSDEMNRSPFDRFKVPRTESQELINGSQTGSDESSEELTNNDRISSPPPSLSTPVKISASPRPALKAFHSKVTSGQLPTAFHSSGALAKLEKCAPDTSAYFKAATPIRTTIGKARTSGLSRKKSVPPAKQNTLAKFGFHVLPKISGGVSATK